MKTRRARTIFFLLLITVLISGCGGEISPANTALLDPLFAKWGTTDELLGFGGDTDLSALDAEEMEQTDSMETTNLADYIAMKPGDAMSTTTPEMSPYCRVRFIRLRWGQFQDNTTMATTTDWSGTVTVNRGRLVLRKTIAFEPQDLVATRTSPKMIEFTSKTKPDFDGLALKYIICDPRATTTATTSIVTDSEITDRLATATLTFTTGPYTKFYSLKDLDKLHEIKDVGTLGNKFEIQAIGKRALCEGFMHGRWKKGEFKGIVESLNHPLGHIKGSYETNASGEKVWSAKFISRQGHFKGILKGTYGDGSFKGDVYNKDRKDIGDVTGRYIEGTEGSFGTWSGAYTLDCAEDAGKEPQ